MNKNSILITLFLGGIFLIILGIVGIYLTTPMSLDDVEYDKVSCFDDYDEKLVENGNTVCYKNVSHPYDNLCEIFFMIAILGFLILLLGIFVISDH